LRQAGAKAFSQAPLYTGEAAASAASRPPPARLQFRSGSCELYMCLVLALQGGRGGRIFL